MSDKKGIAYYKDWIYVILFVITILGYGTRFVLMADQVKRNKTQVEAVARKLEEADLKTLNYRLGEIESKVNTIYEYIIAQ